MMTTFKKKLNFLFIFLFTGAAFIAPVYAASGFDLQELLELINKEENSSIISYSDLLKETQNMTNISGYSNIGFLLNDHYYGLSFTKKGPTMNSDRIDSEMTKTLASRAIFLPEIRQGYERSGLPEILKNAFIKHQMLYGINFHVDSLKMIKKIEGNSYIGFLYLAEKSQIHLESLETTTVFLRKHMGNLREFSEQKPAEEVMKTYEYCIQNINKLALTSSENMRIKLYLSILCLNKGEKEKAQYYLNLIPDNYADIFVNSYFDDMDFLQFGDMHIIFNQSEKAFAAWAYGMQINPFNEKLEERFNTYSQK